jgi:electron transfer flavoprotein alpha subunit
VDILLTGYDIAETVALTAAGIPGVNKVVVLHNRNLQDSSTRTAEDMCKAILGSGSLNGYTHILHSSSNNGKSFIPRMAAMVDSSPLTDVIEVIDHETFKRPMYAGNLLFLLVMLYTNKG